MEERKKYNNRVARQAKIDRERSEQATMKSESTEGNKQKQIMNRLNANKLKEGFQLDLPLDLFQISEDAYSNKIDIWDILPKYNSDQGVALQHKILTVPRLINTTVLSKLEYITVVEPTIFTDDNGEPYWRYPSVSEWHVEEVLRKIAVSGKSLQKDNQVGVKFSLYEVYEELKKVGHTLSYEQIKQSLMICHKSNISISTGDNKNMVSSTIFPHLYLSSKGDDFADSVCYVTFHPLVTVSLQNATFRLYNYEKSMMLKTVLSKYLYSRLIMNWKQAHKDYPYTFSMNAMVEQSGKSVSKTTHQNIRRRMESAVQELVNANIIQSYDKELIKEGRKIIDLKYTISPSSSFVKETLKSNASQKKTNMKVQQHVLFNEVLPKLKK